MELLSGEAWMGFLGSPEGLIQVLILIFLASLIFRVAEVFRSVESRLSAETDWLRRRVEEAVNKIIWALKDSPGSNRSDKESKE